MIESKPTKFVLYFIDGPCALTWRRLPSWSVEPPFTWVEDLPEAMTAHLTRDPCGFAFRKNDDPLPSVTYSRVHDATITARIRGEHVVVVLYSMGGGIFVDVAGMMAALGAKRHEGGAS